MEKSKNHRIQSFFEKMGSRMSRRILLIIGGMTAIALLLGGVMGSVPSHRNLVSIEDPVDDEIDEDFDILSLEGSSRSEEMDIELHVRGEIQESGYVIRVLARESEGDVHYQELILEHDEHGSVHWEITGGILRVAFLLHGIEHGAYLVGLEAETLGGGGDLASEKAREELQVEHVVELPLDPIFFLAGGVILGILLSIAFWKME